MRKRAKGGVPQRNKRTYRLYRSGETVPPGTYVSLDEGRLVHLRADGVLPSTGMMLSLYLWLSESPEYQAPLSLLGESTSVLTLSHPTVC